MSLEQADMQKKVKKKRKKNEKIWLASVDLNTERLEHLSVEK